MALPTRFSRATALALGLLAAVAAGGLATASPKLGVVAAGAAVLLALAVSAPTHYLIATLVVAAIVPYDLQHRFSGHGSGLVLVDVMLLLGALWGAIALARRQVARRTLWVLLALGAVVALLVVQVVRSVRMGQAPGDVLLEFRQTFAIVTVFLAVPLLADPEQRPKVLRGLVVAGLIIGFWGLVQWVLHLPANASEDFGVSNGVQLTTSGTGKLLGGRYVYPAATILAFGALAAPWPRSRATVTALLGVLLFNTIDTILTFERAFWLATVFGLLVVVVRSGRAQRARALVWGGGGLLLVSGLLAVVAPSNFSALRERLLSVGQYHSDTSVTYRLVESQFVLRAIREAPVLGQGLGASVYWGIPDLGIEPEVKTYSHNGYLRLAWKLGVPLAAVLFVLMAQFLVSRRPREPLQRGLRNGAQAALLAFFVMAITAPIFSTLSAMAVIGLLGALVLVPADTRYAEK